MRSSQPWCFGFLVAALACSIGSLVSPATAEVSAVPVDSSTLLFSGAYADGQVGDLILENDEIAVVISAIGHVTHQALNGGTVIDAGSSQDRVDALAELYTYFDDDWPRQAMYTSLSVLDDGSSGGPAIVRAIGHDSIDPELYVSTDYSLQDGARHLTLETSVINTGGGDYTDFELGDAFAWGDCEKFAPGYGFSLDSSTVQAWIAGIAHGVSYGFCGPSGDLWGPNGAFWSDVNVVTVQLGSQESAVYERYLVVGNGDLASVAMDIHQIRGTPVGNVTCEVSSQADGSSIANAMIDAFDASEQFYLQMRTEPDGRVTTTLPAGSWRLAASAPGYSPADRSLTVTIGGVYDEQFSLFGSGTTAPAIGDTLTVIQRPLLNIPSFVRPGDALEISCAADPATTGWGAQLSHGSLVVPLEILGASYDASTLWWTVSARLPAVSLFEQYDLRVTADGGLDDTTRNAVRVLSDYKSDYYFVQISDTHLPDHRFSDSGGAPEDSTETVDLRAVIEDINLIQPEFVLITGDFVNEGELEDYLDWRCYTRAQRQLTEFEVPVFLIAGNHDLGGWPNTPPPDGTARRDWWRFFGWKRFGNPPPGAPWRTQNYSFDYGPVHFTALESYVNYDMWLSGIYGSESFTSGQMQWLSQDLSAAAASQSQILFYHRDFSSQINLNALGIEMALSGHIHSDQGSIASQPFDLSTNNVCDGERSYRVIRVSNGVLNPQPTVSAGFAGQNLNVAYSPANDGTHALVTATVTNNHSQSFEHAELRIVMPKPASGIEVVGGTLKQVDESGSVAVCYVGVDLQAMATQVVSVSVNPTDVPENIRPLALRLDQNHPNPFNPATQIGYYLPRSGPMTLGIFDLQGREIATLIAGWQPAGEGSARWDGRDGDGREVATGVYVARLITEGGSRSRKIVLVR